MSRIVILVILLGIITAIVVGSIYYYKKSSITKTHFPFEDSDLAKILENRPATIMIYSPAFENNTRIPDKYTCMGLDVSLPLKILNIPKNTKSLVIIMADPDAPSGVFYHWLIYRIPQNISELPENIPKSKITKYGYQGLNSFNKIGYNGPCPPIGHGAHHYYIIVIALDTNPNIPPGASISLLIEKIKGHVLAYGYIIGIYSR